MIHQCVTQHKGDTQQKGYTALRDTRRRVIHSRRAIQHVTPQKGDTQQKGDTAVTGDTHQKDDNAVFNTAEGRYTADE